MLRRIFTVGLASLVLAPALALGFAAAAQADYAIAWEQQGASVQKWAYNNRYYAHWECDVGGTVVAAGIFWVWLTPPSAVVGAIAGAAFSTGCHVGAPDKPGYMVGVPYMSSGPCWIIYPQGNWNRRFEECMA